MPEMKFNCKYCGQPLEAPNDMLGEIIDCPKCQRSILIPESTTIIHLPSPPPLSKTKSCPFCAEDILFEAIKCKHCGEMLTPGIEHQQKQTKSRQMPNVARGEVLCPNCHGIVVPKRKSKGNFLVFLILCLFWILPGVIYFIAMYGYTYSCPQCGNRIQR